MRGISLEAVRRTAKQVLRNKSCWIPQDPYKRTVPGSRIDALNRIKPHEDLQTLQHELAHGLYGTNPNYRKAVAQSLAKLPSKRWEASRRVLLHLGDLDKQPGSGKCCKTYSLFWYVLTEMATWKWLCCKQLYHVPLSLHISVNFVKKLVWTSCSCFPSYFVHS